MASSDAFLNLNVELSRDEQISDSPTDDKTLTTEDQEPIVISSREYSVPPDSTMQHHPSSSMQQHQPSLSRQQQHPSSSMHQQPSSSFRLNPAQLPTTSNPSYPSQAYTTQGGSTYYSYPYQQGATYNTFPAHLGPSYHQAYPTQIGSTFYPYSSQPRTTFYTYPPQPQLFSSTQAQPVQPTPQQDSPSESHHLSQEHNADFKHLIQVYHSTLVKLSKTHYSSLIKLIQEYNINVMQRGEIRQQGMDFLRWAFLPSLAQLRQAQNVALLNLSQALETGLTYLNEFHSTQSSLHEVQARLDAASPLDTPFHQYPDLRSSSC